MVARLLKPKSRLGFSLMHPAFNSSYGLTRVAKRDEHDDGTITNQYSVKISRYIQPHAHMAVAMIGQPRTQHFSEKKVGICKFGYMQV